MPSYLIDPKAPLLFRDGRPFGAAERAETLPFPLPSTLAGALRTAYAEAHGRSFTADKLELLALESAGPLLAARGLDRRGARQDCVYLPKPADAVYFRNAESSLSAIRLAPGKDLLDGEGTDLPKGLLPVFLREQTKSKPAKGAAFWMLEEVADWLADDGSPSRPADAIGVNALPVDIRTHVAVDPATLTSRDGYLFQTAGLDFGPRKIGEKHYGWENRSYGLLMSFRDGKDAGGTPLDAGRFRTVGGERRPAWIEPCGLWPELPEKLAKALDKAQGVRLMLATPALFKQGWLPGWLDSDLEGAPPGIKGLKLRLRAAALDRWQPFSGWDLQARDVRHGGAARETRRLAPAGSVYWFEVLESQEDALRKLWLVPVSDGEQDRRDGFGLAVPGVWSIPG